MLGPVADCFGVPHGWRRARLLLRACCLSALVLTAAQQPASAFEIFGMKFFEGADDDEPPVVDPLGYTVAFDTDGSDPALDQRLRAASTLLADEERPVSGSIGLISKARNERELLVATLFEASRYDATVDIRIAGRPLDDIPPDADFGAGPVPVSVSVSPGVVFVLGNIAVQGDGAGLEPARFGLLPGGNAGSAAILRAETDMVRALREQGRPLARTTGRDVVADHTDNTLDVTITLEAGPVAPFGETRVEGTENVDREFTRYMAGIEEGKTYSPEDLADARERLLGLEVFNSATVAQADALDPDGSIPVDVTVSERKHRYFGVGATFSNTDGGGIEGYWGHRNLFGKAEKLRIEGGISRIGDTKQLGQLDYRAAILFEKPGVLGPPSKFTANFRSVFEHPDAYDRFSVKGGVGIAYDISKTQSASAELSLDYSKIEDSFGTSRHLIASVPLQYVWDRRDDKLDPKSGFRLLGFVEPSYDILGGATFVKLRGEASAYQALDDARRFVIAGRVAGGSIAGASLADVPADRRFYAGGGGSVRGYGYQGIGPKDINGKPTGGLSYAEGSLELRLRVTDTLGIVPFIDAGTVSTDQVPDFSDIRIGAGAGVRYLTPFGPLRVDVGVPLNRRPGDPTFGIYAGIGQAF